MVCWMFDEIEFVVLIDFLLGGGNGGVLLLVNYYGGGYYQFCLIDMNVFVLMDSIKF